jgi:hypothetical protein
MVRILTLPASIRNPFRDRFHTVCLIFAVRPDGAFHQWREDPPRELSIALVADERFGWVTNWIEAS